MIPINNNLQDKQFTDNKALLPFLKRIFKYASSYKRWFWGFVSWIFVVALADAIFPLIWMHFLDNVVKPSVDLLKENPNTPVNFTGLSWYAFYFLLTGIIATIGVYYFVKFAGFIQETVMFDLRREMYVKLQALQFSFYDKSASGWLLSRISSDTDRVSELISWGFLEAIWGVTMIIACLGAMFFYNWKLTLIVLFAIPVLIAVSFKIRLLILEYSRKARKLNSEVTASYSENLNGIAVNKITAQEERAGNEFKALSNRMRGVSFKAQYYTAMYLPLVIFIGSAAAALVLYFGGLMAINIPASITIGTLAAFFSYATMIFMPILDIARFYALAQGSLSAGERIFSLIDEPVLIKSREGATDFGRIKGDISFKNVDFQYVEGKPVLANLNLDIKAGQSVALVGATGSGKTTISNLVCRFYEPTKGTIHIDGQDIMDKTLHSLRSQLGVVLQSPHLFSGTIRDNIRYARLDAEDADIHQALKLVGADDFIARLDEEVGEGGENLSMGESQLVSFARAILAQPRILIMDEATSSIDTLTEARIQKSIHKMISGRTALVIAHRLSTIKNSDRILVIEKGKIIEDGNHAELIQLKGHYYRLYTKQLKKKEEVDLVG